MKTENLSTLKIHKLTKAQYDRELAAGNIDANALYLTPEDTTVASHTHQISDVTNLQSSLDAKVPTSRTINGKALTDNITLTAADVGITIPTVNNATLTIQKNGTNVATFTANSSSNATANITVPTGAAADKGVDTSISAASTSTNLPTSKAVADFVEGKGYKTTDNNTTYTFASGTTKGAFSVTPSGGSAQSVSVYGLATVATSGSYNDLSNKPTIPAAYSHPTYTAKSSGLYKVTVDGTGHVSAATAVTKDDITGLGIPAQDTVYTHPANHAASMITGLATVATSGKYSDLSGLPTIPAAYTHPSSHPASMITGLATVATSGSYNDLSNKPTIPTVSAASTSTAGIVQLNNTVTSTSTSQAATANAVKTAYDKADIANSTAVSAGNDAAAAASAASAAQTTANTALSTANSASSTASSAATTANAAMPKSGGTFTGATYAQNNTSYTTYQIRNAAIVSATPSSMTNGTIAFVYS